MKKFVVYGLIGLATLAGATFASAEEEGEAVGAFASLTNSSAPLPAGHFALVAKYANDFLSANNGTGGQKTIFASSLVDGIDDPSKADELKDFYVIDVRSNADYQKGHIPGAVNIPLGTVASPAALASLPTDKPLLLVCVTGHTASIATAVLATLGYDAWTLRFGMTSWKGATTMAVYAPTDKQSISGGGYPMVIGPNAY